MTGTISASESFCWKYATDTFYCNYAGDNVCLQVLRFYCNHPSTTLMLVDLSVAIMQVTVSAALMQVKFSAANMWVTLSIVIMQMGVSDAIMQNKFSAMHYGHDCFYCNYIGDCFC